MPRLGHFTPWKEPASIVQDAGLAPGTVWTVTENFAPTGVQTLNRPARSESFYRLRYPGPPGKVSFLWCNGQTRA
jgi:hypothetical protein